MKILLKKEYIYSSNLLLKFINIFLFSNLKVKVEKMLILSFFLWKKHFNLLPLYFFFESLLKIRPMLGFYLYIIKKKGIKKIKITPYFMTFDNRWKKAIYWINRSLKIEKSKNNLPLLIIKEFYNITFLESGFAMNQKMKHYKTLMVYKTSKNYIW